MLGLKEDLLGCSDVCVHLAPILAFRASHRRTQTVTISFLGMEHAGFLQFEDEDEVSRAEGRVEFTPSAVVIRIGDTVAAELRPADLTASKVADGRYRLEVGGEGMIFEPSNPDSLDKELAAHAFSTRLSRSQPPAPVPAETSPTPTPVLAPRPTTNPPKSPGVAAVLSFLWPGLGQIYNGEGTKAALFIIAQIVNFFLTFVLIGFITGFAVWIWSMVDAYKGAETYNQNQRALGAGS